MTESDWAACNDPDDMVRFLRDGGKLTERKARLFAVACCFYCFWYRLGDDRTRIAVGVAARHAEGLAEDHSASVMPFSPSAPPSAQANFPAG
jgi:hypothetical protein